VAGRLDRDSSSFIAFERINELLDRTSDLITSQERLLHSFEDLNKEIDDLKEDIVVQRRLIYVILGALVSSGALSLSSILQFWGVH